METLVLNYDDLKGFDLVSWLQNRNVEHEVARENLAASKSDPAAVTKFFSSEGV